MAAGSSFQQDEARDRLRQCLNRDKIKLWLPPYSTESGEKGDQPTDLIEKYSKELKIENQQLVEDLMEQMRLHALEKLASRKKFKEKGLLTLKVRLAGYIPEEVCSDTNLRGIFVVLSGVFLQVIKGFY